jgi:5-dehydro-2-deoxygluconokinase
LDCGDRACAFAVSRLLCSPTRHRGTAAFLVQGSAERALPRTRRQPSIGHDRRRQRRGVCAIDHAASGAADRIGAPYARIGDFKRLAVAATAKVAAGGDGFGMLLDETYGRAAMFDAAKHNFWIGRPMEVPGSRPLRFEFSQMPAVGHADGRSAIRSSVSPSIIRAMMRR